MTRKIILNLAISLDGYIADENGGFEWITGDGDKTHDTEKKFNFETFTNQVDTLVMGRKAYEDCPAETMGSFKEHKIYVATTHELESKGDNVEVISGDITKIITNLKNLPGKNIWLWGGAGLVDPFIKMDVIDEYIIGIIPMILGAGRSLFLNNNPGIKLHLDGHTCQEGIIILRYSKRK